MSTTRAPTSSEGKKRQKKWRDFFEIASKLRPAHCTDLPPPYTPPLISPAVVKNRPVSENEELSGREARHVQMIPNRAHWIAYDVTGMFAELSTFDVRSLVNRLKLETS